VGDADVLERLDRLGADTEVGEGRPAGCERVRLALGG